MLILHHLVLNSIQVSTNIILAKLFDYLRKVTTGSPPSIQSICKLVFVSQHTFKCDWVFNPRCWGRRSQCILWTNPRRYTSKQSSHAGNRLHMIQAKSLFYMVLHTSVCCPYEDVKIRSPWTVCFDVMHRFLALPCAPIYLDTRFSWPGPRPFGWVSCPWIYTKVPSLSPNATIIVSYN